MSVNVNQLNNQSGSSISGVTNSFTVTNPSNTANSQAKQVITVGGSSSGDAWQEFVIGSSRAYAFGIDNSDSDFWKMTTATAVTANPSTTLPMMTFKPGTGFQYSNEGTNSFGIGIGTDPDANYSLRTQRSVAGTHGIALYNPSTDAAAVTAITFFTDTTAYGATIGLHADNASTTLYQKRLVISTQSAASSDGIVLNVEDTEPVILTHGSGTVEDLRMTSSGISFDGGTDFLGVYDQGTWTPALTGSSGAPTTITYGSQVGSYTRVGNLVYVSAIVSVATFTLGGGSGDLTMTGLPFTINATIGGVWAASMDGVDLSTGTVGIVGQLLVSTTNLRFLEQKDNAASTTIPLSALSATDVVRITGCYIV